jgi:hypothetical protein
MTAAACVEWALVLATALLDAPAVVLLLREHPHCGRAYQRMLEAQTRYTPWLASPVLILVPALDMWTCSASCCARSATSARSSRGEPSPAASAILPPVRRPRLHLHEQQSR